MTNQEILDNAPEGATHYVPNLHYIAKNKNGNWMRYDPNGFENAKWFAANDFNLGYAVDYRSLADIERIVELESQFHIDTITGNATFPSGLSVGSIKTSGESTDFGGSDIRPKSVVIGEGTCCDNAEKLRAANQRIKALEQAIMSNCYDDPSTGGKRLMALVDNLNKQAEELK
jgi:hypothetical protein